MNSKDLCMGFVISNDGIVDCKLRDKCLKFVAKGDPCNQSYFVPGEDFKSDLGCSRLDYIVELDR